MMIIIIIMITVYPSVTHIHISTMCFALIEILKEELKSTNKKVQCIERRYTHKISTIRFESKNKLNIMQYKVTSPRFRFRKLQFSGKALFKSNKNAVHHHGY